jgi:hypothetical protein
MQVVEFLQTIIVSGAAVTLIVQFLKSNFIPPQIFNKYPRLTTFAASIVATLVAVWQKCQDVVAGCQSLLQQPLDYAAAVIGIFIIAVVLYNNVLRDKPQA